MADISYLLYLLSAGLLVPVVISLLLMAGFSSLQLGGFLAEAFSRRHKDEFLRNWHARRMSDSNPPTLLVPNAGGLLDLAANAHAQEQHVDCDDLQLRAERAILLQKIAARLGPILGLAGTLIPLGPGLRAFAEGDTTLLSESLVIAFSTTVIGLIVGGVNFCTYTIRCHWYTEDLRELARPSN